MIQSRRNQTNTFNAQSTTHAGLWLEKYLDQTDANPNARLVKEIVESIRTPEIYESFYNRWKTALESSGAKYREARASGRLAINLGNESVLETSIALHRTYGTPYITGSALKGLAANYARNNLESDAWLKDGEAYTFMFGDPDNAGFVHFFDALYVPGTGHKQKALWQDIITVHHPKYYQASSEPPPPADWDSPTPIPFLSATGNYLIALAGPEDWVDKAFEILALALEHEGIGAKTTSGYGRMKFIDGETAPQVSEPYALRKKRLLQETPPAGRFRGSVAKLQSSGGFAFIQPARGGREMFVHASQVRGNQPLRGGQVVEYRVGQYQGRDQAQDVEILLEPDH